MQHPGLHPETQAVSQDQGWLPLPVSCGLAPLMKEGSSSSRLLASPFRWLQLILLFVPLGSWKKAFGA